MCTQRRSISAVCGYSSLSIMFLSMARSISRWTCGSSQVWQNVARFCRLLPSSSISSATSWKAFSAGDSPAGKRYFGSGAGQGAAAEDGVVDPVPDVVTLVKGHADILRHSGDRGVHPPRMTAPGGRSAGGALRRRTAG